MKILLLGKTGLLGSALFEVFKDTHAIDAPPHRELPIERTDALNKYIHSTAPELVINATGYTKVDEAETEQEAAFRMNAKAVTGLAKILADEKIPLVHFSTDYVFAGNKKDGYAETDTPAPLSVYGVSKAAGEFEVTSRLTHYYLVRTAWLYGPGGKNFVDTMLALAQKGEPIRVVNDQIGNPTYSFDLAKAVLRLLEGKKYGIYHMVNEGSANWYEFAVEIFHQLGVPQKVIPITTQDLSRPARRPAFGVLRNTKAPLLRHWKEALKDYLMHKEIIL